MNYQQNAASGPDKATMRPQLVQPPKKRVRHVNDATCLNLGIKRSIQRVVLDSELDITDMRNVSRMFRMPQRTIIEVLREGFRDLKAQANRPPTPPAMGKAA